MQRLEKVIARLASCKLECGSVCVRLWMTFNFACAFEHGLWVTCNLSSPKSHCMSPQHRYILSWMWAPCKCNLNGIVAGNLVQFSDTRVDTFMWHWIAWHWGAQENDFPFVYFDNSLPHFVKYTSSKGT